MEIHTYLCSFIPVNNGNEVLFILIKELFLSLSMKELFLSLSIISPLKLNNSLLWKKSWELNVRFEHEIKTTNFKILVM